MVTTLDLATQSARDLTATEVKRGDLNFLRSYWWLADGWHVAYRVGYFRSEASGKARKPVSRRKRIASSTPAT